MMRTGRFIFIALMLTILLASQRATAKEEIIVSAAASLTSAMTAVGQDFEKMNPDMKVVFNFAASGSLLQQMIHGAPVDVFASANQKFMNHAQEKNLILPDTRKNFVQNKLVLVVPADSRLNIREIKDLCLPHVKRISLGNPEFVPAGRYAREALTAHTFWDTLADKFVFANSVRQISDYVSRGEVDAGIFYATDAKLSPDKVKFVMNVGKHSPIIYPIAVLESSKKKDLAGRFIAFVLSKDGQNVFARFGFGKP